MSGEENGQADAQAGLEKVRAVKEAYADELMAKANVVGVGVGLLESGGERTGTVAVVVMVRRKVPRPQLAAADIIPTELEGVPVDVQEVGEISAQR
ncbi:MAG: hypothetical protein PVG79_09800 [Gemmatimonadales bacterium]|jgi:hypothetical protein